MSSQMDTIEAQAEFAVMPPGVTGPMRPHITAPHAKLFRYGGSLEKPLAALGAYDPLYDNTYDWPNKPANSKVDLAYAKLYMDDAMLLYFEDLVSANSTIAPVGGHLNRIRSDSVAFKANGDDYDRSALLYDRDVRVGDIAIVRGTTGGESYSLTTYVKGFVGETIAASVDTAEAESSNAAAQGAATSVDKVGGPDNSTTLVVDGTFYDGLEDGDLDETYFVEVTTSSSDSDFRTARIRITSASGNDDVAEVTPDAAGDFDIGTRGLRGSVHLVPGASASSEAVAAGVAPTELIAGQKYRVAVSQQYVPVTATSSGTYTGDVDTTIIVEVTKGGIFADSPEISCTTTTGVDLSGPTVVSGADSAVAVGSKGVFISFSSGGLCKGDRFLIPVTAEAEGAMQTLILGHNLPSEIRGLSDLDLSLYIKKNGLLVPQRREGSPSVYNWTTALTGITVKSGITVYESSWTDGGTPLSLPVKDGLLFAEYRAWLSDWADEVGRISELDLITSVFGPVHPDNPLAFALWLALLGSGGQPVLFSAVADPDDSDSWSQALELISFRDDVYKLAAMTHDRTVLDAYAAHVDEQSISTAGLFRTLYRGLKLTETEVLVSAANSTDGEVLLAKLSDDPDTDGTQYTYLEVTSGNTDLITAGVRAGDTVRFLYTTDGFGGEAYTSFTVAEVVGAETLLLTESHGGPVPTAQKMEVWRAYTKDELATQLISQAEAANNPRVSYIWPDLIDCLGFSDVPGYFATAVLAGLRCGTAPHRSLRDVILPGLTAVPRTNRLFTTKQIRRLATNRVWVLMSNQTGSVYSVASVTSANPAKPKQREEGVRTVRDADRKFIFTEMRPFLSRNNIHPRSLESAGTQLRAALDFLRSNGRTSELGPLLIDADFEAPRLHVLHEDRLVVRIRWILPQPYDRDMDVEDMIVSSLAEVSRSD